MARQFDLTTTANQIAALPDQNGPLNHYCVKLSYLCPQLKNLSLVDTQKLLTGNGLVINVRVLEPEYCMSGFLLEGVNSGALTTLETLGSKQYDIFNMYLAVV